MTPWNPSWEASPPRTPGATPRCWRPESKPLLAEAGLSGADIDAVVTGVGPGPFTGLRSGIVTARTLAFVWGKPLYGLMSLDAIALEVAESTDAAPELIVATDARRKEVYWARYSLRQRPVAAPAGRPARRFCR